MPPKKKLMHPWVRWHDLVDLNYRRKMHQRCLLLQGKNLETLIFMLDAITVTMTGCMKTKWSHLPPKILFFSWMWHFSPGKKYQILRIGSNWRKCSSLSRINCKEKCQYLYLCWWKLYGQRCISCSSRGFGGRFFK